MDLQQFIATSRAKRRDGWTVPRRLAFLRQLAATGKVTAACAAAGLSREAAYRLRKRDPQFAKGWAAVLEAARIKPSDPPPCCPINGIVEVVTYRGRPVGTRRRYSTRLLLAHLGRLDRLVARRSGGGCDFNARTV